MAKDNTLAEFGLRIVYFGALVTAGAGTWLVGLDAAAAADYGNFVVQAALVAKAHTWVVVVCPVVAAVAKFSLERFAQAWTMTVIHSLLTDYRAKLFASLGGAKHHHRATLFVRKRFALRGTCPWRRGRLPWSGWLVPIARSDHTTQKMRTRFLAPDQADQSEGVAGSTWSHQATITVVNLPRLTLMSSDADIKDYCDKTSCDENWLRRRLADGEELPRSLRGLPIEVNDVLWGVVVLDSRHPSAFTEDPGGAANFTLIFSSTIGRLMEKARI